MKLARLLFRLRPEEAAAIAFVLPTSWLTIAAFVYAREAGVLGPRYPGGVLRLGVVLVLLAGLALALRRFPGSALVQGLRETVPLLACLLIYTNLHDTIGFVNPHDVHHALVAADARIFGVQPCVWAERFITPALTELMQFLYLNFFWIAPSVSAAAARAEALARVPHRDHGRDRLLLRRLPALRPLPGRAAAARARRAVHEEPARLSGGLLLALGRGLLAAADRQPRGVPLAAHRRLDARARLTLGASRAGSSFCCCRS